MEYLIHISKFQKLEKKLATIEKKCIKYENEFTYNVIGEELIETTEESGFKSYEKYIKIFVSGLAKVNNWIFIATLDARNGENIIRRYNFDVTIPIRFYTARNVCEHCNTSRKRKDLYLIHNVETGEYKQVGRTCLKDFTKGLDAELVASYIELMNMVEDGRESDAEYDRSPNSNTNYYRVSEILEIAYVMIKYYGFIKASNEMSTTTRIKDYLFHPLKTGEAMSKQLPLFDKKDFESKETIEMAEKTLQYGLSLKSDNEFVRNLQIILSSEHCKGKDIGLLACLPFKYMDTIEKQIQREKTKEKESASTHVGKVGDRFMVKNTRLHVLATYGTMYGVTVIYRFFDEYGNVFIWKSSTSQEVDIDCNITLTVKSHNEFNSIKQTEVTRCKVSAKG